MEYVLAGVTILFALAWCAAALLHRASAALRHVVWTCALAAALLLAPLRWRLPHRAVLPPLSTVTALTVAATPRASSPGNDSGDLLRTVLLALWALGTLAMTARLLRHAIRLRAIVRSAPGHRPVLVSPRIRGPLVAGFFRPVILLPEASNTWSLSRRRAVLAHEAAHIRRRDPAILLAAHIATAVYWFHPLCWLAAARLRAESERACDDAALRTGLLPSGYAGHLLDLAGHFDTQLAIPMATTSHLESRVKSILDPMTNRSLPARAAWPVAIALTAALLAPLSTFTLQAQQAGGAAVISGTVTDPSGARVPGAKLIATNSDSGYEEATTSDPAGVWTFTGMSAGHYTIEVQAPGFAAFRLGDLTLVNGGKLQVDARLSVGRISESIRVAGGGTPNTAAPPAAVAGPQRIRVGGSVQAAALITQVKPVYPPSLLAQGIEATVLLQAIISKEGVPQSLSVLNATADPAFVNAAMDAVSQWRYRPTLLNGEPIEVITSIQVDFTLTQ